MINHYEILGLSYSAGIAEIKASFRHLAKIYHPDKNPDGIEHFTKILKAYETLSDPTLKASYDYKLNYHQAQTQQQTKASAAPAKNWKFDERELKRRQYYNDHIKKYAKQTSDYMAEAETKKNYNEFKYILFATPLAVLLFLLIMHMATRDKEEAINTSSKPMHREINKPAPEKKTSDLKLGDAPYTSYFGTAVYDNVSNKTLSIKNLSGREVIVCLFTKDKFVRCFYMTDNISAEVSQLPVEPMYIYYSSGLNFDYLKTLTKSGIQGGFTKESAFYKSIKTRPLNSFNELTLLQGENEGFKTIDEQEFFKRAKK